MAKRKKDPAPISGFHPVAPSFPTDDPGDEILREKVRSALMVSHQIDTSQIKVHGKAGNLVLEGSVPDQHSVQLAEALASSVPGVKTIENRIRVVARGAA